MEGKKQEETIQNMEQENAAFLNSKKEEQKETVNKTIKPVNKVTKNNKNKQCNKNMINK